jgi:hypothetical protein
MAQKFGCFQCDAAEIVIFASTKDVPYCSCLVSFTDPEGIEHSVRVSAASLYEALFWALSEFRRQGFVGHRIPTCHES